MQGSTSAVDSAVQIDASLFAAAVSFAAMLVRRYGCDSAQDASGIVADCWILKGKIDRDTIRKRFTSVYRGTKRRRAVEIHSAKGEIVETPRESVDVAAALVEVLPEEFQDAAASFASGETFGASKPHFYKLREPIYDYLCGEAGLPTHAEATDGINRRAMARQVHGWQPIPADQINLD